jgi:hypothetical protein
LPQAAPRAAWGCSPKQRTVVTPYFNDWKRFVPRSVKSRVASTIAHYRALKHRSGRKRY